ncbi:MAG: DNA polymerase III subunit delta' [Methylobacillus sp.]|jgi:DNA polymerase-3 subunit delta'|nr:DNA polymerase III subunit delta' [Methylobacillus sp.]
MMIYPWQHDLWNHMSAARERLPHALLLQGRPGIGKLDFAEALAAALLCEHPAQDGHACGQCDSCNWNAQGNHPDLRVLTPDDGGQGGDEDDAEAKPGKKSQVISIAQVRELAEFLNLSSHRARVRLVLLHPAEALNAAAANALLKMLEEPPPGVLFILVTHQPQRLLPTIRSRCNKMDMPFPERAQAESWLATQGISSASERLTYVGGAPLLALRMEEDAEKRLGDLHKELGHGARMDPFFAASLCAKEGIPATLEALQKWTHDLVSARLAGEVRYHMRQAPSLQALANGIDLSRLLDFQRVLHEARRTAQHPLNAELQVESLMIQYTQLFSTVRAS